MVVSHTKRANMFHSIFKVHIGASVLMFYPKAVVFVGATLLYALYDAPSLS